MSRKIIGITVGTPMKPNSSGSGGGGGIFDYVARISKNEENISKLSKDIAYLKENGIGSVETTNVFAGKTASFYGDSLTESNYHYTKGYHQWIKELLGLTSYNNYGVSGYRIATVNTKVNSINDTSDIIFVMCGVNDETFSTPLGTFGDSTTSTIYGGYDVLCSNLKAKYPTKIIVFITPHYQTKYPHDEGVTSYEVSKAMKEVCEKYAIPVYDNFVLSGIYPTNLSYWTTDNCHWNDKAHEMLGRNLSKFMIDTFRYCYGYVEQEQPDTPVSYTITRNLTNCKSSKSVATVTEGTAHTETITANSGYTLTGATISVTMGGVNISSYYSNGVLNIPSVTGNIVITVKAVQETIEPDEPEVTLAHIDVVFNQGNNVIYETDSLETLKQYLTVTAKYSNGTVETITSYSLNGLLNVGTNTITVFYEDKTNTFVVTVVEREETVTLKSISAIFEQGDNAIYETATLNDLKQYLTVTAKYSNDSTVNVNDYTLSGNLTEGTNEIIVIYLGKTTTFNVTVTKLTLPNGYTQVEYITVDGTQTFDTEFIPTANTSAVYKISQSGNISESRIVMGSDNQWFPSPRNRSILFCYRMGKIENQSFEYTADTPYVIDAYTDGDKIKVDGVEVGEVSNGTASSTKSLIIGDFNGGSNATSWKGNYYFIKIYENDILVRYFIPCKISNNTLGMYECVNDKFYMFT
jgi:lysophospholipase L1-like esterase